MKWAFSTNAYRNYSIEAAIDSIHSVGYSAIELMCDIPHAFPPLSENQIESIKKILKKNNMKISNLNGFMMCAQGDFHHPSWIETNNEFRKQRIEYTKKCINLARILNVKTVSTEPGGPLEELSEKKALDLFEEGINQVIPLAEKNNVKLLIETEPNLLIENSSQFLNFISHFKTRYLGLNFDIGHFFCVNENPSVVIKELKDYIGHIHLEDISQSKIHKHLIPGTGSINFESILEALYEINYKGYVTVELYPYLENPEQAAKAALLYLQSLNL